MAEGFYEVHRQRPFFGELVQFMTRSPVVVAVLERDSAVTAWRELMGATDPAKAARGHDPQGVRLERGRERDARVGLAGQRPARDRVFFSGSGGFAGRLTGGHFGRVDVGSASKVESVDDAGAARRPGRPGSAGPGCSSSRVRMSSESNGRSRIRRSRARHSGGVNRISARAPSAWGAVARRAGGRPQPRGAAAQRERTATGRSCDLLPELRSSAGALREAFERRGDRRARATRHGRVRRGAVGQLDALLDAEGAAGEERDRSVRKPAPGLSRTSSRPARTCWRCSIARPTPSPPRSALKLMVREAGRMSGTARGREVIVRFDEATPDCVSSTGPLRPRPGPLAAERGTHAAGANVLVLRARGQRRSPRS